MEPGKAPTCEVPLEVTVVDGEVVMMGDRVSTTMTAEAALESARRIQEAAELVISQRA